MVGASLKRLLENDQLVVGISELSDIVGVSPRQLRYWEQKGFIRSIEADANCPRKYRLPTVIKVELIKKYLDDGFTLSKLQKRQKSAKRKCTMSVKFFQKQSKISN